ncbi:protein TEX261 [Drosophila guanche]|uniref:Protein TEX261 n=1 Tax=Drosophila guanche TaxID=7266 RepID=A0A3B0J2Y7_DROGU|nr:protein TEX261 [Drosophila guanche]XP_034653982.1 protein TEX261 [Drosophila subobscura]SPP73562.1 blast:Protein TEX261 [Drosophila guanche]
MGFLYILGWISLGIQITFLTLSIVAGLYYLAELAEEYTTQARRCILFMISFTIFVYIMLMVFEDLPWSMLLCGFVAQGFHLSIMGGFPFIRLLSVPFLGSLVMLVVNHLLAFQYFTTVYVPFTQVLAYFTICMWIVPFALFVSLSANDSVLPTVNEQSRRSPDVVSNYFSRNKKQGLLSLFNYMKEQLLPARSKKAF